MTTCVLCRWAEMTPREKLRAQLREWWYGPDVAQVTAHAGHNAARMLAILNGGPMPPTAYDEHRRRYAETGDPLELERMLRHVGERP